MSGRRPSVPKAPRTKTYEDVVECEVTGKHRVTITAAWPPPRKGLEKEDPNYSMQCEKCGTNLIVYEFHGDDNPDIEVIRPGRKPVTA